MTIKLDAIAEAHPELIAEAVFSLVPLPTPTHRVLEMSLLPPPTKPALFFTDPAFWNYFKSCMTTDSRAHHHELKEQKNEYYTVEDAEFERRLEYCLKLIDIAREIWEDEVKLLRDSKYNAVYSEGDGRRLITSIAEEGGIPVVYLDADNPFFIKLQQDKLFAVLEERDELQRQREELWVAKIKPEQGSLIIAGAVHLRGDYGLDKRLLEKGMQLNIIGSFDRKKQIDDVFEGLN